MEASASFQHPDSGNHSSNTRYVWVFVATFVLLVAVGVAMYWMISKNYKDQISDLEEEVDQLQKNANQGSSGWETYNQNSNTNSNTNTSSPTTSIPKPTKLYVRSFSQDTISEVYEIALTSEGIAQKVLSEASVWAEDIYSGMALTRNTAATPNKIDRKTLGSTTTETLVTLTGLHTPWGIQVNPTETGFLYDDHCGFECSTKAEEHTDTIRWYDFATKTEKDLSEQEGVPQGFRVPHQWLDADTAILEHSYEATEGATNIPEIFFLDIPNGPLQTFALDSTAIDYAPSPDGKQIAYSTFIHDSGNNTSYSTIVVKTTDGKSTLLKSSGTQYFEEVRWLDSDTVVALVTNIESVQFELGYSVSGSREIQIIELFDSSITTATLKATPGYLVYAMGSLVYYSEYLPSLQMYTLHRVNIATSGDEELFRSSNSILFVGTTPR
ncbi:MAG: hypothetical protein HYZ08_00230 [Candidatus Kerfeldbacteria bacterium]|nr:hypothetical protein [Candidatus Kerfeldbacteria bacterium]